MKKVFFKKILFLSVYVWVGVWVGVYARVCAHM